MKKTLQTAAVTVNRTSLSELFTVWSTYGDNWAWNNPFITPPWLKTWWNHFAGDNELLLLVASEGKRPLGMAPLMHKKGTARFIGSNDLCDYGDFVAAPGEGELFSREVLRFLAYQGVDRLILEQVRRDSLVYRKLIPTAQAAGWRVSVTPQGASVEMDLPASWEEYLQRLAGKQRHEVRRKLRRVEDAGMLDQSLVRSTPEVAKAMDLFVHLFRQSRKDKMEFMTGAREIFFRSLATELSHFGMLNLFHFTMDGNAAAAVFCIELGKTTYLYNNGFAPRFRRLSMGVVSKIATIRSSIEAGRSVYDFLSGTEKYKYQLGGEAMPLMKCIFDRRPT